MVRDTRWLVSGLVSLALALPFPLLESVARAADPLEQARELYNEGQARFDTFDFDGAIELWTRALSKIPRTDDGFVVRSLLSYNIAAAQLEAFKLDHKTERLRRVLLMLDKYEKDYIDGFPDGPERDGELKKIGEKRVEVQALLDGANEPDESDTTTAEPVEPAEPVHQRDTTDSGVVVGSDEPKDRGGNSTGKPLIVGGGVMLGLGAAGLGAMGAGMVMGARARDDFEAATGPDDEPKRLDLIDDGERANTIAIAGGVVGGLFLVTGAALMAVGLKKRNGSQTRRTALNASIGHTGAVLTVTGRF